MAHDKVCRTSRQSAIWVAFCFLWLQVSGLANAAEQSEASNNGTLRNIILVLNSFEIEENPAVKCDDNSECDLEIEPIICFGTTTAQSSVVPSCTKLIHMRLPENTNRLSKDRNCADRARAGLDQLPPECVAWRITPANFSQSEQFRTGMFSLLVTAQDYEAWYGGGANDDLIRQRRMSVTTKSWDSPNPLFFADYIKGPCDIDQWGGHNKNVCEKISLEFRLFFEGSTS